ncbi:ATP-binding cassette domain-containing protein [Haloarcula regularis]|uniref:hypothetical protein n=1 Tax=Haloarcula regularis TaxID=3033392 RepID=UPI0023E81F1B|nr:hypothetical protein [Halomicroarcula sp. SYNS111]
MSRAEDAPDSSATSQAPDTKVRFEDIMKQFGRLVALESIDLTVRDGEILALVGQRRGEVDADEHPVWRPRTDQRDPLLRRRAGDVLEPERGP